MGKSHRENFLGRKKIIMREGKSGIKRRNRKIGRYIGPWSVVFSCGQKDYHPLAAHVEIINIAQKAHICGNSGCEPKIFIKEAQI